MDAVAGTLVDVALSTAPPPLVNVVHPRPVPWGDIFGSVNKELALGLPTVPFAEWFKLLEERAAGAGAPELEKVVRALTCCSRSRHVLIARVGQPALKILDFYRDVAAAGANGEGVFDTAQAVQTSPTLAALPPLGEEHVKAWVGYWRSENFL